MMPFSLALGLSSGAGALGSILSLLSRLLSQSRSLPLSRFLLMSLSPSLSLQPYTHIYIDLLK